VTENCNNIRPDSQGGQVHLVEMSKDRNPLPEFVNIDSYRGRNIKMEARRYQ
jgi:hypothetical protein